MVFPDVETLSYDGRGPRFAAARGFALLYVMAFVALAMGFLMLAVDWGRVQLAKTELMAATTAAARAAMIDMASGKTVAINSAVACAGQNNIDGTSMLVTSADVTVGTWDRTAKTFTANTSSPNAVSVRGIRSLARGTAIPLTFGAFAGVPTCDVSCTAVASNAADVQVDVSAYYNNVGMAADGATYSGSSGVGNDGYALPDTAIGGTLQRGGTTYTLCRTMPNCIRAAGQTLPLPAGDYKSVVLIVAHAYGAATSTLTLNNNDGTHTLYAQTYSDWCNPAGSIVNQNVCGSYSYRNLANGTRNNCTCYLMSYEFTVTSTSGVASITLPNQGNMAVFAVGVTPAASITVR